MGKIYGWIIALLFYARLYAVAPGADGGGGDGNKVQVDPTVAREALADLYDPDTLKTMDDTRVTEVYGKASARFKPTTPWGDSWRTELAGDNKDALKTLERFPTPKEMYQSYASLRQQRDSGELRSVKPFPDKGTVEQQAAWRAENGVPAEAKAYEIKPPDGVVIGKEDEPYIESWKDFAHKRNMSPEAVNASVAWWAEERVRRQEEAATHQTEAKKTTEDALRTEWGAEYRGNMSKITGLIEATTAPEARDLRTSIMAAIETNPDFARHYAMLAYQLNPHGTLTGAGGGEQQQGVEDGLRAIDKIMNTAAYRKDAGKQSEYRRLLGQYERMTGNAWRSTPGKS